MPCPERGDVTVRAALARFARRCAVLALLGAAACRGGSSGPAPAVTSERVFVTQAASGTLLAVDAASGESRARIELGMLPHNVVVSPDRRTLYVALVGSQAIAEVSVETLSLRRTMLTAPVPEKRADGSVIRAHIDEDAFSASSCYGCHRADGAMPKYAGDRPFGMLLSPDGKRLYVTHLRESRLTVLDLEQGSIETTKSLEPSGAATEVVAIERLDDELWVALRAPQPSKEPGALRRLDADTLEPLAEVATGADPGALLALAEHGAVLVSNFESNTVTLHRASDEEPGANVKFEAAPGPLGLLALDSNQVLALDYYSDAVSFLDLESGTSETLSLEAGGVPFANPTHAALSTGGQSAWIVSSGTDGHLLELDLRSRAIVRDVPIEGLSFGVAVVSGTFP